MFRISTFFLQAVIVLIGIGTFALLLWEPQIEGVNANATNMEIYFKDPFLLLVYAGSIPFFIALYQVFKLLGNARHDGFFSRAVIHALRTIRYCALAIIGFVFVEEVVIVLTHGDDDVTGGIAMGIFIIFGSVVVAAVATLFTRLAQQVVDIQSKYSYPK